MVNSERITHYVRAYIKLSKESVLELSRKLGVSRAHIYRIKKQPITSSKPKEKIVHHRPEKLDFRSKRSLLRHLKQLRYEEPNWTIKRLMEVSGVHHVSTRTINRFLNRNGYRYLQARRKGLMSKEDREKRVEFAKRVTMEYTESLWTKEIAFYLDGVSFEYKRNPKSQCMAPSGRVWRRPSEGLSPGCIAKGSKCGTGGNYVKLIVAISYIEGVVAAVPYEKMTGEYFAQFLREHFEAILDKANKNTRLFLQDGDPSQNSCAAKEAMKDVKANLFSIPPRSPDINPIENFFHLVRRQLEKDAISKNITKETKQEFQNRILETMHAIPKDKIDKTIQSLSTRMHKIVEARGKRLKY